MVSLGLRAHQQPASLSPRVAPSSTTLSTWHISANRSWLLQICCSTEYDDEMGLFVFRFMFGREIVIGGGRDSECDKE